MMDHTKCTVLYSYIGLVEWIENNHPAAPRERLAGAILSCEDRPPWATDWKPWLADNAFLIADLAGRFAADSERADGGFGLNFPIPERPDHLNLLLAEFRRLPREAYERASKVSITLPDGTVAVVKDRFGHRTHNPLDFLGEAGRKWYRSE